VNTYGYVGGNPVNQIDPNGTNAITGAKAGYEQGGILGGIGGAAASILGGEAVFDKPQQCESAPPQHNCDLTFDANRTALVKIRNQKLGLSSYSCVYMRKGVMFTFPQWINKECYSINYSTCMVDTSTMDQALYGK
jgi:hypothetical protein